MDECRRGEGLTDCGKRKCVLDVRNVREVADQDLASDVMVSPINPPTLGVVVAFIRCETAVEGPSRATIVDAAEEHGEGVVRGLSIARFEVAWIGFDDESPG